MNRKKLILLILGLAALVGTVSAAVLTYYGRIETSVTVGQSVVLDDKDVNGMPIEETIEAIGGDMICKYHWLRNRANVPATVELFSSGYPEGVTIKYCDVSGFTETVVEEPLPEFPRDENYELKVIVTYNPDGTVTFRMESRGNLEEDERTSGAFTFDVEPDGIADFQVEIFPPDLGETHYKEYDTDLKTWVVKDMPDGFVATYGQESDYAWRQLTIPVSVLGGYCSSYKFGAQINIHVNQLVDPWNTGWIYQTFPDVDDLWGASDPTYPWGSSENYYSTTVGVEITGPITLEPGEVLPFYICYEFDIAIAPGTFTIYTEVRPSS